ncbi:PQQ-binding-like beta-propeller repeat protein [Streptomyces sp. NPDC052396]|uniref:protein kinase domain-containing protein n=1 Tax=Streptomyces sp. NPDC052396 TaxID=3365689 RepID=UPI0037CD652D
MLHPLIPEDPAELGGYRLLARLGGGGMGTVYLARSARGRTVALKTVHPQFAEDATLRTRFRLEVDAARVIGSRYGARVFDADPLAPLPWLATEYVLGPPLGAAVTATGPLPERTVRALGFVLCGALRQLHASDVVHRDLKPSNVLLAASGPKLIDFGIARAMGDHRLTHAGTAAGTPAFMSPEQAAGLEHTSAGDVFALAGLLVFAATGHGPFGLGRPADLLYRVRHAEPDLTRVPDGLRPVLAACLSKDPGGRPDAAGLAREIDAEERSFADVLPDGVLSEIARRATEVWQVRPHRTAMAPYRPQPSPAKPGPAGLSRRGALAVAGGSVLALGTLGAGLWALTERRGHRPTGGNPAAAPPRSGPRPANVPERAVWWATLDKADPGFAPMTVGDLVVVMSRKGLVGFDATSGNRAWTAGTVRRPLQVTTDGARICTVTPPPTGSRTEPVLSVLSTGDGSARTLPADFSGLFADGQYLQPQALAVGDGTVYLSAYRDDAQHPYFRQNEQHLLAIDIRTGAERWRHRFHIDQMDMAREFSAVCTGGHLVVTRVLDHLKAGRAVSGEDWLGAFRAKDGSLALDTRIPRLRLADPSPLPGRLAVADDQVCLRGRTLRMYRISDGRELWEFGEGRNPDYVGRELNPYGDPLIKDGVVYAAEGALGLIALDAHSGRRLWDTKLGKLTPVPGIPFAVGERLLYVPAKADNHTKIVALDRHMHRTAWTMDVPGGLGAGFTVHQRARRIVWASGDYICAMPLE